MTTPQGGKNGGLRGAIKTGNHKKNWGNGQQNGIARKTDLGNTNTPEDVAQAIVDAYLSGQLDAQAKSLKAGKDPQHWIEPAVGTGNFYIAILRAVASRGSDPLAMAMHMDALDIDPEAIGKLRERLTHEFGWDTETVDRLPIHCMSLADFKPRHTYDVAITNPPYLAPKNWSNSPETRAQMLRAWQDAVPGISARADLFMYFFGWCHNHLSPGGRSLFLCSDGWVDSEYGKPLREAITTGDLSLETMAAWPWTPLFRDDTCPIVTVIRKQHGEQPTRIEIHSAHPADPAQTPAYAGARQATEFAELSREELTEWLCDTNPNRRALITQGPGLHRKLNRTLKKMGKNTVALGDVARLTGSTRSFNDLERTGRVLSQPGATGKRGHENTEPPEPEAWANAVPIFFQKQARVGKPVDYRQVRFSETFGNRLILEPSDTGLIRTGGAWFSLAIDRLPIAFAMHPEGGDDRVIAVSKYAHIQADATPQIPGTLLAAILSSTPAILSMERRLKEGTRKTLRKNENGYAKEVTLAALRLIRIPSPAAWTPQQIGQLTYLAIRRAGKNISRLDQAVQDPDWLAFDDAIGVIMGLTEAETQEIRNLALALYWRRMRNTLKYGEAESNAGQG